MESVERLDIICDQGPFLQPGQLQCAALCVGGRYTRSAVYCYRDSDPRIHTLIDWPAGLGKPTVRQIEAVAAAKDGTHAIELAVNMPQVVSGNFEALRDDLMGVIIAVREVKRDIKVHAIIEATRIGDDQGLVKAFCLAVQESGGDGIVTSTGFPPTPRSGRETTRAVEQVVKFAGPLWVKAICPPDDPDGPDAWLTCGVDRVGVAASVLMR